ncbi:hypothetical protein PHISP_04288 [Aspergillus sp. HF37]|nr:hypothetical protein PHISP_04288 [Aspergillus sp. HF37]
MGINRLTKHLLPFSEPVILKDEQSHPAKGAICIDSVVIDGPSLVYHVFSRLLSWKGPTLGILDAQPSCHEVSFGVMIFLLQLACSGITINKICFDGALPVQKRETRLSRLEKSRQKLELLRSKALNASTDLETGLQIDPRKILCGRSLPARYKDLPENPFMVSAVFEDLKHRWNKQNISAAVGDSFSFDLSDLEDYPWTNRTVMVPGEADVECARISRSAGCATLTNDSDLLIYDLGTRGSVVFLNSMELNGWSSLNPAESSIKAVRICPSVLARHLGIANVQRFAYELSTRPRLGLAELIQHSKDSGEVTLEYSLFVQEYQNDLSHRVIDDSSRQRSQSLDTRVSEVFWQYKLRDVYMSGDAPHIYLGILNEDHARKCAWEHGRQYRSLGYSALNASCPSPARFTSVYEYTRRGGRIAVDRITLDDAERVAAGMKSVCERLTMAQTVFGSHFASPTAWRAFALCEVYIFKATQVYLPNAEELRRFFRQGHMGKEFNWSDLHLIAETQAVLYSLRVLKQLLEVTNHRTEPAVKTRSILAGLPPLHVLMRSRHEMTLEYPCYDAEGFEDQFFCLWERIFGTRPQAQASPSQLPHKQGESRARTKARMEQDIGRPSGQQRPFNIYEFLSQQ